MRPTKDKNEASVNPNPQPPTLRVMKNWLLLVLAPLLAMLRSPSLWWRMKGSSSNLSCRQGARARARVRGGGVNCGHTCFETPRKRAKGRLPIDRTRQQVEFCLKSLLNTAVGLSFRRQSHTAVVAYPRTPMSANKDSICLKHPERRMLACYETMCYCCCAVAAK